MSGRTTSRGRARRDQLLDVALVAFAEKGYRGTSMSAIADRAGISEQGVLHHFPSKVALLHATLAFHQQRTRARAFERAPSFPERLERLAGDHEEDDAFIRLLLVIAAESVEPDHPTHPWFVARYERVRLAFERELAADQGAGTLDTDVDVTALARLLVGALDGLEFQLLLAGGELDILTPLRHLLGLFYGERILAK